MRPGTFWSGLTTLIVLAVPVLSGFGLLAFHSVYESPHYLGLLAYGLLALGSLLGYRYMKAKAGTGGVEVEASQDQPMEADEEETGWRDHPWREQTMPIREYHCEACGRDTEQIEFDGTDPLHKCPTCGGFVRRVLAAPAVHFKGHGWTGKLHHRGLRADWKSSEDTLEEDSNGKLRPKTGAGHEAP